jgi:hypothetical protein
MEVELMDKNCATCAYLHRWVQGNPDRVFGECHRFPKSEMKNGADWCGEWKNKQIVYAKTPEDAFTEAVTRRSATGKADNLVCPYCGEKARPSTGSCDRDD